MLFNTTRPCAKVLARRCGRLSRCFRQSAPIRAVRQYEFDAWDEYRTFYPLRRQRLVGIRGGNPCRFNEYRFSRTLLLIHYLHD